MPLTVNSSEPSTSASPRSSFGTSPVTPAASRMKNSFSAGSRSTSPKPDIAHEPQHIRLVGEQPVEAVGRNAHRHGVEAPPALIALEHRRAAGIEAEPHRVDHRFRQRRDIAQSHIQSLPRDRMDDMRGVADQRDALGDEASAPPKARADRRGADRRSRCRRDAVRSAARARRGNPSSGNATMRSASLFFFGPDDRRALALERQDRERTGGQEMLLGAAVVIALMRDGRDDAGLVRSPSRSSRCRPVRGSPSARRRRRPEAAPRCVSPSDERDADRRRRSFSKLRHGDGRSVDAHSFARVASAPRSAADSRSCARTARPARSRRRRSGRSAASRRRAWNRSPPCRGSAARRLRRCSQTPMVSNSRRAAAAIAEARASRDGAFQRRIGDGDAKACRPSPGAARWRARGRQAAAADQDVRLGHAPAIACRACRLK